MNKEEWGNLECLYKACHTVSDMTAEGSFTDTGNKNKFSSRLMSEKRVEDIQCLMMIE